MFNKRFESQPSPESHESASGFDILRRMPSFAQHMEQLTKRKQAARRDRELQALYKKVDMVQDEDARYRLAEQLQNYNLNSKMPFLASGQSSYFNQQIDTEGFGKQLQISTQDQEDAKFIANCFGHTITYGENDLPILYTALPGTAEINYAMQSFPAGIYEDVFQCSPDHSLPISPKVGEQEPAYWRRVLAEQAKSHGLSAAQTAEVIDRGGRIADHFCHEKNRIYFIPIEDLQQNKASFGDVVGLRDASKSPEDTRQQLSDLPSLRELSDSDYVYSIWEAYNNANFNSDYGIAIYGPIKTKNLRYIEVDRTYDIIQKRARANGMAEGEVIPSDFIQ